MVGEAESDAIMTFALTLMLQITGHNYSVDLTE